MLGYVSAPPAGSFGVFKQPATQSPQACCSKQQQPGATVTDDQGERWGDGEQQMGRSGVVGERLVGAE